MTFFVFAFNFSETMCSKRKSWEYYLTRESKSDAKESLSCFSLNLSELSTKTAIRNMTESPVNDSHVKFQNNERIKQMKGKGQEKFYESKYLENPKQNCSTNYHEDIDSIQKFEKVSDYSYNLSDFSAKALPRHATQTSQKAKTKLVTNDKLWEIERHNEHFMKKLLKAKPTTNIKKSTSEMVLLQVRSEQHVPSASVRRRQKQAEINTLNGIMQKKLNAIASKKV